MVVYYDKTNNYRLGSDYQLHMELKTIWGIQRRLIEHNRRMKKQGMIYYKIVPYHVWKKDLPYPDKKYYL